MLKWSPMSLLSALTMIYAEEFLDKGSTAAQGTYAEETSGIPRSSRVAGRREETPRRKGKRR